MRLLPHRHVRPDSTRARGATASHRPKRRRCRHRRDGRRRRSAGRLRYRHRCSPRPSMRDLRKALQARRHVDRARRPGPPRAVTLGFARPPSRPRPMSCCSPSSSIGSPTSTAAIGPAAVAALRGRRWSTCAMRSRAADRAACGVWSQKDHPRPAVAGARTALRRDPRDAWALHSLEQHRPVVPRID